MELEINNVGAKAEKIKRILESPEFMSPQEELDDRGNPIEEHES